MKKVYGDDPIAAFTSALNVFKRDWRLWKTINVRAGQDMLWTKKTQKLCVKTSEKNRNDHGIGIRNSRRKGKRYADVDAIQKASTPILNAMT